MSTQTPIPRQTRQFIVTAAAAQALFGPSDYILFNADDVQVRVKPVGSPNWTILASDQYTVAPAAPYVTYPALFTVTLAAPRAAGDLVWIKGARLPSRMTNVTRAGKIQSQPLESELDAQAATEQELRRDIDAIIAGGASNDLIASGVANDSLAPGGTVADALSQLDNRIAGSENRTSSFMVARASAIGNVVLASLLPGSQQDGVVLAAGDIVILPWQTSPAENGLYEVRPISGGTRAGGFTSFNDHPGKFITVAEGDTQKTKLYRCTSNRGGTLGTTPILFDRTNGVGLTVVRVVDTAGFNPAVDYAAGAVRDGVTLAINDLVLRAVPAGHPSGDMHNGVYIVRGAGAAPRAPDFIAYDDYPGRYFAVAEGTAGKGKLYRCISVKGGTLGATAILIDLPLPTLPTTTRGDMVVRGATVDARLPIGPAGSMLRSDGIDPSWSMFKQAGTGAVDRDWLAKARDIIHAADFGVVANGVANDTAAMNLAIAAAAGKRLQLPAGVINITAPLTSITGAGGGTATYIQGAGMDATKIIANFASGDIITFDTVNFGGVRDLTIAPGVTRTGGAGIKLFNAGAIRIENCNFVGMYRGIHRAGYGDVAWFLNNFFNSIVAVNGIGILMDGNTGNAIICNNMMQCSIGSQAKAGIRIKYANGVWLQNNDTYQTGEGLLMDPGSGETVAHIFSMNNAWDSGNQNGVNISPSAGGTVTRVLFTGEWMASNTLRGAIIDGAGTVAGVSFSNCCFYVNGQQGIYVGKASNFKAEGCTMSGNSTSSANAADGILIGAGVSDFQIIGNRSGGVDGFPNLQRYGICVGAGASNNYIIALNNTQINLGGGLLDAAGGATKVVTNNL